MPIGVLMLNIDINVNIQNKKPLHFGEALKNKMCFIEF